jgi:tetratricopeptide (TPR) repeat protein
VRSARVLSGQVVTFVGKLTTLSRKQAAEIVLRQGGLVDPQPTGQTTLIVVAGEAAEAAEGPWPPLQPPGVAAVADGSVASRVAARPAPSARAITEDEFCRIVGRVPPAELRQQYYAWRSLRARYPAVRDDHLRYLEKWALLRTLVRTPGETYCGFADLAVIKQANAELTAGATFRAVVRSLVAARNGQLSLDFRTPEASGAAKVVAMASRPITAPAGAALAGARLVRHDGALPLTPAELRFLDGERLDSADTVDLEAAMDAYRDAIELDGTLAPAMVNLGNLHYALDHVAEAQGLYLQAAIVDAQCFEARFNLGNVHHDAGRYEEAAVCYRDALRLNPTYPDAHFYLAVTLEKLGRSQEAQPHWRQYRTLAPNGEWVELANEFSE